VSRHPDSTLRGAPSRPIIEVQRPDIANPVRPPVDVRVRFISQPGTSVDLSTFRATYGWAGIDVTNWLLANATLTPSGLTAENADLPPGEHKLTLSIADTFGEVGSQTFKFTVIG
jgi:hypothetical protein